MKKFKNYILLAVIVLLQLGCQKDKDEIILTNSYIGTLKLQYSRTFPEFSNIITMDVEVDISGEVTISQPSSVTYDATDSVAGSYKVREEGSITLSSLSGEVKLINNEECLVINVNTLISGSLTTWGWDDENAWGKPFTLPFVNENPTKNPHNFIISDAVMSVATIGKSVPAVNSEQTYKWTLFLTVIP